jgi:plasmid maintenance system antidote protein VapI
VKHPSTVIKAMMQDENITLFDVANGIGIPENSLKGMLKGRQYLSPVNAVKIARFFGKQDAHFLVLQTKHQASVTGRNANEASKIMNNIKELMIMSLIIISPKVL